MCIIFRAAKNDVFTAFWNAFSLHLCTLLTALKYRRMHRSIYDRLTKGEKIYKLLYTIPLQIKTGGGDSNPTAIHNWQTFRYCLYQTPDIRLKTALPDKQTPVNSHPASSHFWADTHISLQLNWWIVFRRNERKHFRRTVPGKQGRS